MNDSFDSQQHSPSDGSEAAAEGISATGVSPASSDAPAAGPANDNNLAGPTNDNNLAGPTPDDVASAEMAAALRAVADVTEAEESATSDEQLSTSTTPTDSASAHAEVPSPVDGLLNGVVLTGRTAVVTGASGNIGAEIAVLLARLGAHVIVADLPGQPTDVTVERIQEFGSTAEVWDVDLRDHELLANVHLECDILVNSAGSSVIASIEEFDPVDWDRIIDVMLTAPFLLTRAALPHMYKEKWGRIINISGVNGLRGSEGRVAYAAAKHGLEGLTKVTALEAGEHNVTANCVNPGFARTAHTRKLIKQEAQRHWLPEDEVVDKVILRRNAIKDMAEPQEIAAQVAWLCSDYARLITGTNIVVDGGVSAS